MAIVQLNRAAGCSMCRPASFGAWPLCGCCVQAAAALYTIGLHGSLRKDQTASPAEDRVTVLPENLLLPLQKQLAQARALHDADLRRGW